MNALLDQMAGGSETPLLKAQGPACRKGRMALPLPDGRRRFTREVDGHD